jgi:hypothetical protein
MMLKAPLPNVEIGICPENEKRREVTFSNGRAGQ